MTLDPRWAAAKRVLAVRLDNLGDVLMSTPALAALRHALPQAQLTLLGSPASMALAPHLQDVDALLPYAAPWTPGEGHGADVDLGFIDLVASRGFDAAVIFTVCTQSALPAALLCRLAGIPLRLAHTRENPYHLLTHWVRDDDRMGDGLRHEVQRQLDLLHAVGVPPPPSTRLRFHVRPQDHDALRRRLAAAGGDPQRPWLLVHPGATAASRRWPPERFAAAADRISAGSDCQVVFVGGPAEQPLVQAARAAMQRPSISLCGAGEGSDAEANAAADAGANTCTGPAPMSLGELAAAIAGAALLVCNNSGPAHIAAAVGTPVVVLYALTNPQHTPWQAPAAVLSHDVPCRNCLKSVCPQGHHACLLGVAPDAVAQAGLDLMAAPLERAA